MEQLPILALDFPDDITIEAFRSLRTSLHFGMLDASSNAIVITSAAPDSGKSFVSVNLAVVAAQSGLRVALVDADLRRGQLRKYFGLPRNSPGLAQYLTGTTQIDSVVYETDVEDLIFMPTGRYPPNPSELLMRRELHYLIRRLETAVDLIVIDSPPVLAVTDPVILSRTAGASILVVRHGVTSLADIEDARKTFSAAGLRFAGSILNFFDPRKARRGYGYRYHYGDYEQRSE